MTTVKELIKELLEYNMDSEVELILDDEEFHEFEVMKADWIFNSSIQFRIDHKGMKLIDGDDLEELKDSVEHLEGRVKDLEEERDSLQQRLDNK